MNRLENDAVTESAAPLPWTPATRARDKGNGLRARLAELVAACGAFEWVALGYLSASNLWLLFFHHNVQNAPLHIALHSGISALTVLLCWAAARRTSPVLRFVRHWYPQAFFLFCFEELHYLVHLIFRGWFDRWLIAFDRGVLGVHPTVWLEQFARPALNDIMQMAYITYFFYLVVLGGILYVRREERAFWTVMTCSAVAYVLGYAIALFFPVESPYYSLATLQRGELTGGFFTQLVSVIERFGRVHGAAFPSLHVTGSLVALLGAWRYRRWLFWTYLPFFVCMMVSTVYGRYHYFADVLGGLVTGAIGFRLGERLMHRAGACPAVFAFSRAADDVRASRGPAHKDARFAAAAPRPTSGQPVAAPQEAPQP